MKRNCVINRFGKACLIHRANGRHELVGGNAGDYTNAKEWASLFAHDVVFSRSASPEQLAFCFTRKH